MKNGDMGLVQKILYFSDSIVICFNGQAYSRMLFQDYGIAEAFPNSGAIGAYQAAGPSRVPPK